MQTLASTLFIGASLTWIVFGTATGIAGRRALRSGEPGRLSNFLDTASARGLSVYRPCAVLSLVSATIVIGLGPSSWTDSGVVIGLPLLVMAVVLGSSYVGPRTDRLKIRVVDASVIGPDVETEFLRIELAHYAKLALLYATLAIAVLNY